jgi:hypothetical protein
MDFLLFLEDFHLEQKLKLSFELIKVPLNQLFSNNPSSMVFKHFQDCLHLENSANDFLQLFQLCSHQSKPYSPSNRMCFGSITSIGNAQTFW